MYTPTGGTMIINFALRFPVLIPVVAATVLAVTPVETQETKPTPVVEQVVVVPAKPIEPVVVTERGVVVLFDFDKSIITPKAAKELKEYFAAIQPGAIVTVTVAGHTDIINDDKYNDPLGDRRANAVKKFLVQLGIVKEDQVLVSTFGRSAPTATNKTKEGRQLNRRVEVFVQHY